MSRLKFCILLSLVVFFASRIEQIMAKTEYKQFMVNCTSNETFICDAQDCSYPVPEPGSIVCNCDRSADGIEKCNNPDFFNTYQNIIRENQTTRMIGEQVTLTPGETVTSTSEEAMCPCDCEYRDKIEYWSIEANQLKQYNELSQRLAKIKRLLKVANRNLSSFINTKISAADERPSASAAGYFGAAILVLVFGLIVLLDLPVILRQIRVFLRNIRG